MSVTPSRDSDKGWPVPRKGRSRKQTARTDDRLTDTERRDRVLAAFEQYGLKKGSEANQWSVRCPCHDDKHASAGLRWTDSGKWLFICYAGCGATYKEAFDAVGLDPSIAFPGGGGGRGGGRYGSEYVPPRPAKPPPPPADWARVHAEALAGPLTPVAQQGFAADVGVSLASVQAIEITGKGEGTLLVPCWPERAGNGQIIGRSRRYSDGSKKAEHRSKHGLIIPTSWQNIPGPVLCPEGPTDVAAGLTMGLPCIGRPNNYLATTPGQLMDFATAHPDREVIILGENDYDPNRPHRGSPGQDGARKTARALAGLLGRPVAWSLPPDGAKDLRVWWLAQAIDPEDATAAAAAGQQFLEGVIAARVVVEPLGVGMGEVAAHLLGGGGAHSYANKKEEKREESNQGHWHNCARPGSQEAEKQRLHETIKDLLGLSLPPPPCACPRPQKPLLQHRQTPQRYEARRLCCKAWVCVVCSQIRAYDWALILAEHLLTWPVAEDGSPPFHVLSLGEADWTRTRPKLSRAKAQYIRFAPIGLLLTTVALDGSQPVSAAVAVQWIGAAIQTLPPPPPGTKRWKPISTSRAWKVPKKRLYGESLWFHRGRVQVADPTPIVALLARHNIPAAVEEASIRNDAQVWRVSWTCPSAWSDDQCKDLAREVRLLSDEE